MYVCSSSTRIRASASNERDRLCRRPSFEWTRQFLSSKATAANTVRRSTSGAEQSQSTTFYLLFGSITAYLHTYLCMYLFVTWSSTRVCCPGYIRDCLQLNFKCASVVQSVTARRRHQYGSSRSILDMFKFRSTLVNQLWRYVQCPQSSHEDSAASTDNFGGAGGLANSLYEVEVACDDRRPLYLRRPSVSNRNTTAAVSSQAAEHITPSKKKQIQNMLMRLKRTHLETLLKAIKSKGATPGSCVMMPSMMTSSSSKSGIPAPNILLCQLFRWPDLQSDSDLKRLSYCMSDLSGAMESAEKQLSCSLDCNFKQPTRHRLYECCNPYHWSRIVRSSSSSTVPAAASASKSNFKLQMLDLMAPTYLGK